MDYIFGTSTYNGQPVESVKTVGEAHTDLTGFCETVRDYGNVVLTDHFRVLRKYHSAEDDAGRCYDWYHIDSHRREVKEVDQNTAVLDTLLGVTDHD